MVYAEFAFYEGLLSANINPPSLFTFASTKNLLMENKGNAASNHLSQYSDQSLILPELPFEVITEILLRLPVKSLLKFKCVSRSWLSLISSSQFIKDHTHLSLFSSSEDKQQVHLLIAGSDSANNCSFLTHCSLTSLLSEQPTDAAAFEINYPPMYRLSRYFNIVGCCNGLFCIDCMATGVSLWNPSTRQSKKLPDFNSPRVDLLREEDYYVVYGFGYDDVNDDYKVVAVICSFDEDYNPSGSEVMVYSIKTGSWRGIGEFQGGFPELGCCGSLVNGKLHWKLDNANWDSVIFLDLATETYGSLNLRNGGVVTMVRDVFLPRLGTFGGSLCLFCKNYRDAFEDVWVMKEYGVKESWTKVLSVPIDNMSFFFTAMCIPGSDRFLVVLKRELRLYNPEDNSFRLLPRSVNFHVRTAYVESLVSPNSNDAPESQQQQ